MQQPGAHTQDEQALFVYGTLMRGQPNAHHLVSASFVGLAQTVAAFTLIRWQGYPGLRRGGSTGVRGELYRVSPSPAGGPGRVRGAPDAVPARSHPAGRWRSAQAYLVPTGEGLPAPVIVSGDWRGAGRRR